ncbi:class I SAM-dependent methyltransferase [Limibaculum sp. M0105]|uniref:Class I SAM-dependent methyltransferase n=1 Tax=Thermohalobaculum xanthum TaxID=2753746 RepID=A0A8J7MB38_9RHOB|nr:class I SAM-dependent methyltransferase [Thermohalobaculum xanthum]MBK0401028.1 class I SAM-dependent methyltransferase [Thermohalobaculum xanthum]
MAEAAEWAGRVGLEWARRVQALDRQLAPAGEIGLKALDAHPGERVIDLGCGAGAMTQAIAAAVTPGGAVTALDISPDLLDVARARVGMGCVHFHEGDAAQFDLSGGHDALFSRFGCMFFDNPPAAFARLRRALKPGARVVLTVWSDMARNPWARIPAEVGARVLGPAEPKSPTAPGPFAWADPAYPHAILTEAGFGGVTQDEHDIELVIGDGAEADPVERGVTMLTHIGPLARRLASEAPATRARAADALREAIAPHVRDGWLRMPGVVRIIRARN